MKKLLVALLAIVMVAGVFVPTASADRGWHHGGSWGHRHHFHRGGGCFGCGFVGGLVLGGALAAPRYAPPPVFVAPQPSCYTQPGYWQQVPVSNGYYTQFQNVWVPPQVVCQ